MYFVDCRLYLFSCVFLMLVAELPTQVTFEECNELVCWLIHIMGPRTPTVFVMRQMSEERE